LVKIALRLSVFNNFSCWWFEKKRKRCNNRL